MLFWGKFLGNCFDCSSLSWGDETRSKAVPYFSLFFFFLLFFFPYFSLFFLLCLSLSLGDQTKTTLVPYLSACLFVPFSLSLDRQNKIKCGVPLFLDFLFSSLFFSCLSPCFPCLSFSLFFYVFLVCLSLSRGAETRFSLFLLLFCNQATSWNLFFFSFFLFSSWFSPSFFLKDQRQCPTFLSPVLHYQATSWNFARPLLSRPFLLRSYFSNTESCKHKIRFSHSLLRKL